MATTILAPGFTAATSAPITLSDGQNVALFLRDLDTEIPYDKIRIEVQFQNSNSSWTTVSYLVFPENPAIQFAGPVTFRVKRQSNTRVALGVERA